MRAPIIKMLHSVGADINYSRSDWISLSFPMAEFTNEKIVLLLYKIHSGLQLDQLLYKQVFVKILNTT